MPPPPPPVVRFLSCLWEVKAQLGFCRILTTVVSRSDFGRAVCVPFTEAQGERHMGGGVAFWGVSVFLQSAEYRLPCWFGSALVAFEQWRSHLSIFAVAVRHGALLQTPFGCKINDPFSG